MTLSDIINKWNDRIKESKKRHAYWVSPDISKKEYLEFIKKAKKEIKIVCGRLYNGFYDTKPFLNFLKNFIDKIGIIYIVFGKGSNLKEARKFLENNNPALLSYIRSLDEKKKNIKIYWVKGRARQHFLIIDRESIIFEQLHNEGEKRSLYCIPNDVKKAKILENLFYEYIKKGYRLNF